MEFGPLISCSSDNSRFILTQIPSFVSEWRLLYLSILLVYFECYSLAQLLLTFHRVQVCRMPYATKTNQRDEVTLLFIKYIDISDASVQYCLGKGLEYETCGRLANRAIHPLWLRCVQIFEFFFHGVFHVVHNTWWIRLNDTPFRYPCGMFQFCGPIDFQFRFWNSWTRSKPQILTLKREDENFRRIVIDKYTWLYR